MNKLISLISIVIFFSSCKTVIYNANYGQQNQTQVVLASPNFKVLGSFTGVASEKKKIIGLNNIQGLVTVAKANLLSNAKFAEVELTGSRALANVTVDIVENPKSIKAIISAEIIEFTK